MLFLAALLVGSPLLSSEVLWPHGWFTASNYAPGTWTGFAELVLQHPGGYPDLLVKTFVWLFFPVFGFSHFAYHALALCLHATNTVLIWQLARNLKLQGNWFAALLFAVHPVAMAPIAWIPHTQAILATLFCLIICNALTAKQISAAGYLASLIALPLALLANIGAGLIALVALVCRIWQKGAVNARVVNPVLPHLLISFFLILQINSQIPQPTMVATNPDGELASIFRDAGSGELMQSYMGKLVIPGTVSFWYPDPAYLASIVGNSTMRLLRVAQVFIIAGLFGICLLFRKFTWAKGLLALLVAYLLFQIPLLRLLPLASPKQLAFSNHSMYLCLIPYSLMVAGGIFHFIRGEGWVALRNALVVVISGIYATSFWLNTKNFQNSYSLWDASIEHQNKLIKDERRIDNHPILRQVEVYLREGSRQDKLAAADILSETIDREPKNPEANWLMAETQKQLGNYTNAVYFYREAQAILPNEPQIWLALGKALLANGRTGEAIRQLEDVVNTARRESTLDSPLALEARAILSEQYLERRRFSDALPLYQERLALRPTSTSLIRATARCLLETSRYDQLIALHEQYPNYRTDSPTLYTKPSSDLLAERRYQDALFMLEIAAEAAPDDAIAANNLAWLLATLPDATLRDGERALRLAKKAFEEYAYEYPGIVSTLSAAHAEVGNFDEAISLADWLIAEYETAGNEASAERIRKRKVAYKQQTNLYE